jgi:hypothetical protein
MSIFIACLSFFFGYLFAIFGVTGLKAGNLYHSNLDGDTSYFLEITKPNDFIGKRKYVLLKMKDAAELSKD